MRRVLKDSVYRHSFLLFGAVWLFILSLVFSNYWSYTSSAKGVQKNLEKYVKTQEKDVYSLLNDSNLIRKIIHNQIDESLNHQLVKKPYGIFLYEMKKDSSANLTYWNTQLVLPEDSLIEKKEGQYFQNLGNGKYELILRHYPVNNNKYHLLILIPIHWEFFVENDYLKNGFASQLNAEKNFEITSVQTNYPVKSLTGKVLYYITEKKETGIYQNDWFTIILRLLAVLLFMFFLQQLASLISKRFSLALGALSLLFLIFILRFFSYYFHFPFDFRQFELFSPTIYSSNFILKSLGDLIVNLVLFLWVVLFLKKHLVDYKKSIILKNKKKRLLFFGVLISFYSCITILFGIEIRSIVSDSSISFDVANFFSLDIFTLFGFSALSLITICYSIATRILFHFITEIKEVTLIHSILINLILGFFFLQLFSNEFSFFQISILVWMIFYLIASFFEKFKNSYPVTIINSLKWILIYTFLITILISFAGREKEIEKRIRASEKIAWEADPNIERLISISLAGLKNDFWLTYLEDFKKRISIGKSLDTIPFSKLISNLNKFQNKFYFFDSLGNSLISDNSADYNSLNNIFSFQSRNTSVDGLHYYEKDITQYNYLYYKPIIDELKKTRGYVFIEFSPKRMNSEIIIPEIFKIIDPNSIYKYSIYSYGIYYKDLLVANYNDYPFESNLNALQSDFKGIKIDNSNGFSRLWFKKDPERIVMIVRKSNIIIETLTLFAYIFCFLILIIGLIRLILLIVESEFNFTRIQSLMQFDIKSRIFSTIIGISLISFIVVGATTIYFFIDRFEKSNEERIIKTINVLGDEFTENLNLDIIKLFQFQNNKRFLPTAVSEKLLDIAEIHNTDFNIYDLEGNLMLTSQPLVYNRSVQNKMMNPNAFHHLKRLNKVLNIQTEQTGNLIYLSVYKPMLDKDRRKVGYINIPYFTASKGLSQEISNFLVTLINLNAFIFLIAGLITVFLTSRITNSFEWIGRKMREINLGSNNEIISWNWNDEIGGLVSEYNKMVVKLEENVKSLAKSEREGAWREMARQVAHEIKNPLTPMKLSIQYLQRSIDTNATNVKELTAAVAKTLIEQIEHLSKIASEFSQFANIGNVKNEPIELNSLISSIISFHATQENVSIQWSAIPDHVSVLADRTQMNRLLNNLIRNAIESIPDHKVGKIIISGKIEHATLILEICDNGAGIPEDMKEKIFSPNFTTKTSGTGLGLAICKGIVEQAKGQIWFSSNTLGGTCFYVSLPIISPNV